ncbi:uncharacterized protein LOC135816068 [Sycon ciliatum]|uniref:uncharacterized protein LOC135816068 n=1 Tax=Sycon ciliatum TaxID=27933 RepID=UPI0020A91786|eukprot:scpid31627/ scgid20964/ 
MEMALLFSGRRWDGGGEQRHDTPCKVTAACLLISLICLVCPAQPASLPEVTECDGSLYALSNSTSTYLSARQDCLTREGSWSLAIVPTGVQQSCLHRLSTGRTIWLGLKTMNSRSIWEGDTALLLSNYVTSQRPSNHCTVLNTSYALTEPNWIVSACSERHSFFCQRPASTAQDKSSQFDLSNAYSVVLVCGSAFFLLLCLVLCAWLCLIKSRTAVMSPQGPRHERMPSTVLEDLAVPQKTGGVSVVVRKQTVAEQWSEPKSSSDSSPKEQDDPPAEPSEDAEYVMGDWEETPFYRHQSQTSENSSPQKDRTARTRSVDNPPKSIPNTYDNLSPTVGSCQSTPCVASQTAPTQSMLTLVKVKDDDIIIAPKSAQAQETSGRVFFGSNTRCDSAPAAPDLNTESSSGQMFSNHSRLLSTGTDDAFHAGSLSELDETRNGFNSLAGRHQWQDRRSSADKGNAFHFPIDEDDPAASPSLQQQQQHMHQQRLSLDAENVRDAGRACVDLPPKSPKSITSSVQLHDDIVADAHGTDTAPLDTIPSGHSVEPSQSARAILLTEATLALDSLNEQLDIFCQDASLDSASISSLPAVATVLTTALEAGTPMSNGPTTVGVASEADCDFEDAFAVLDQLDRTLDDLLD